jgi:hypothetical protein
VGDQQGLPTLIVQAKERILRRQAGRGMPAGSRNGIRESVFSRLPMLSNAAHWGWRASPLLGVTAHCVTFPAS